MTESEKKVVPKAKTSVIIAEYKPNVYEKIANIQQSIHTVIKGGYNDFHKYKFARERDVVAEVKPLLGREGLAITHSLAKEEGEERTRDNGKKTYLTKLTLRFRITNIKDPNDFIEADAVGYGLDGEDKGAPKAYTMALKYFLSKMFLIETGDDAEQTAGSKGSKPQAESPDQTFEKAKRMIAESRNVDGLMEYAENLRVSKIYNAVQKKELNSLLGRRVDALQADLQQ